MARLEELSSMLIVRAVSRASGDTLEAPERPRLGVCCDVL